MPTFLIILFFLYVMTLSAIAGSSIEKACDGVEDGWRSVDDTSHMTYVQCYHGDVMGEYECPPGTYFRDSIGRCDWGDWENINPEVPPEETTTSSTSKTTTTVAITTTEKYENDFISNTCSYYQSGKFAFPQLDGFLVCRDGLAIAVEYCDGGKLYDEDTEQCWNHCNDSPTSPFKRRQKHQRQLGGDESEAGVLEQIGVVLPKLAGHLDCDINSIPININVCPSGTHYDALSWSCQNFCSGVSKPNEIVSFPGDIGGVVCAYEKVTETRWCLDAGIKFDKTWGTCVSAAITTEPTDAKVTSTTTHATAPRIRPTPHTVAEEIESTLTDEQLPTESYQEDEILNMDEDEVPKSKSNRKRIKKVLLPVESNDGSIFVPFYFVALPVAMFVPMLIY